MAPAAAVIQSDFVDITDEQTFTGLMAVSVVNKGAADITVDFGNGALYHKKLFWVLMVIGGVAYVATRPAL